MALLDKNGQLLKEYQYTAFGIPQNPSDFNSWRFASKHYDSETHLVYFGRRYYDPVMGRWTTPDPTDYSDGPNLYTYLQNNPLIYIDGYGLLSMPSWQDTKDVGYELWQGAEEFGKNLSHSITSSKTYQELNEGFNHGFSHGLPNLSFDPHKSWTFRAGESFGVMHNTIDKIEKWVFPEVREGLTLGMFPGPTISARNISAIQRTSTIQKVENLKNKIFGIERSIFQKLLKNSKPQISNVDLVINETLQRRGEITSMYKLSANEALEAGEKFLGKKYRELGRAGTGVFRSEDNLRQFRIDNNSLLGKHDPYLPHVHLEKFISGRKNPVTINHIIIVD